MTCMCPGCGETESIAVAQIDHRKSKHHAALCVGHATAFVEVARSQPFCSGMRCNEVGYVPFDLFLVLYSGAGTMLWLREVQGSRSIGFRTGPAEGYFLLSRLGVDTPPNPSSHGVIVNLARRLGGTISQIRVNRYGPAPTGLVIYCSIKVEHQQQSFELDLRASDAFALALETPAPIIVRKELLDTMPRSHGASEGIYIPASE